VLLQGYPNLEYIIIDGGSTDNSVEIIKKYEPWLAYWVSEKDRGQSHAINKGWERATGEIYAYLCSDDFYFSDSLHKIALAFSSSADAGIVVGGIASADENSFLGKVQMPRLPTGSPIDLTLLDPDSWNLPQASAFFSKKILSEIGMWVREDLHYTMDRELFYRAVRKSNLVILEHALATFRHHSKSKTTAYIISAFEETRKSFAYCDFGTDKQKKLRARILKRRLAQGYYYYANSARGSKALMYFVKAVIFRPEYIFRLSFLKNAFKKSVLEIL
jgi:glycosyltransferase involved in cell wall biosynthesis